MKENLGFGHFGSGVTVWDRNQTRNNNHLIIAHIYYNRTVTYYVEDVSLEAKAEIEQFAETGNMPVSETQNYPVLKPIDPKEVEVKAMAKDTRVVNVRIDDYDVYIGQEGKGEVGYFGNPFRLNRTYFTDH